MIRNLYKEVIVTSADVTLKETATKSDCHLEGFLFYIIIRPITVDEKVPKHHNRNRKTEGRVLCQDFRGSMRNMCQSLKCICHGRLDKMKNRDANGNACCIDNKIHPQLMK